jgi:hypothetical protein
LYGGQSDNIDLKNNLIINSNSSYNYYPNQFIHTENGATITTGLNVASNLLQNLSLGSLVGSILNNLTGNDPKIQKTGVRPTPYYVPVSGSPLIDAGVNVGLAFNGSKPDIGAYETGTTTTPTTPSNPTNPTTPTSPSNPTTFSEVSLDASQAAMAGKMTMGNDASAGSYFGVPAGNGTNYYIPVPASATFTFTAPAAGSYSLWVKVKATNGGGFYIYDGKGRYTTWEAGTRSTWTWVKVSDSSAVNFSLAAGGNTVQFGWKNDNVQVDKVVFTTNPNYTPVN